jgi:NAD(P)-dependent dehydrogenase (short-subunit alcohol dehydrogenase family)
MTLGDSLNPASQFDLTGRVAIVTGASSGLGARFVRVLHATGASVVASARRAEALAALAAELGPDVLPIAADISVDDDCGRLVDSALDRFGRIDVLVNNAGIGVQTAAEDEPIEEFRRVLRVNLDALFLMCQLVGRHMIAQGRGSIINVSSMFGLVAAAPIKQASYCASKGAVVNLTRELGVQWARKGVRVNSIAPGWFPSEMTAELLHDPASTQWVERNCPMARAGTGAELDGALLFLASNASSYCTGQTISIDGGWTAR